MSLNGLANIGQFVALPICGFAKNLLVVTLFA